MEQNNNLKSHFSFINIFVLLLFAVVIALISSFTTYYFLSSKLTQLPPETQAPIPQTQPETAPTSIINQNISQEVVIKQINIKTGVDLTRSTQSGFYDLITANGHYLLYVYETKKLIYDGREIYSEDNFSSMALSNNGLYYAYVIQGNENKEDYYVDTFNDLYINNKKVMNAKNLGLPVVTNDGQYYFYTLNDSRKTTSATLFKNDKEIFRHKDGFLNIWINDDGSQYFAELRNIDSNGNFVDSLVKDG